MVNEALEFLRWRGWWEDEVPEGWHQALGRVQVLHRCKTPSDLADMFEWEMQEAYYRDLPRLACMCGRVWAIHPGDRHDWCLPDDGGECKQSNQACSCGRKLMVLGQPEQLALL